MCVNKTGIDVTCNLQIFESSLFKGITALNFNAPHWLLFKFIQVYQVQSNITMSSPNRYITHN